MLIDSISGEKIKMCTFHTIHGKLSKQPLISLISLTPVNLCQLNVYLVTSADTSHCLDSTCETVTEFTRDTRNFISTS